MMAFLAGSMVVFITGEMIVMDLSSIGEWFGDASRLVQAWWNGGHDGGRVVKFSVEMGVSDGFEGSFDNGYWLIIDDNSLW